MNETANVPAVQPLRRKDMRHQRSRAMPNEPAAEAPLLTIS